MLESREYSKQLGVLTHEQLQAALTRFDLGQLVDAEPAPGGLFGQIVLLTTSSGRYALRGHPHAGQIQRERYVAELIQARTNVPVPWPFLIDESLDIFGWEYALMPCMPGVQLADREATKHLTDDERVAIVVALAECLAQLHSAAFEWHGVFDASAGCYEPATKAYHEWFGDWTRWWLDRCRAASSATTNDDVTWVQQVILRARDALAEPFVSAFVHTDFKENNTVAEKEGTRWRISGVFDLADTHLGDGEYDLARAYCEYVSRRRHELAQTYLTSYLKLRPPRPGFRERMEHYILHDRLIIWEYMQRNTIGVRAGPSLRAWLEPFLELPGVS